MTAPTGLLTLYARKEPSEDSIAKGRYHDVVLYRKPTDDDRLTDKGRRECPVLQDGTQLAPCARFSWTSSNKPRQGQRSTMLNCSRWSLIWLPEVSDKRPKNIRIYDNGNTPQATFDRYTVVYMNEPERTPGTFNSYCLSNDPFNPGGFAQHSAAHPGTHLGKRVKWEDLPEDVRKAVVQDNTPVATL